MQGILLVWCKGDASYFEQFEGPLLRSPFPSQLKSVLHLPLLNQQQLLLMSLLPRHREKMHFRAFVRKRAGHCHSFHCSATVLAATNPLQHSTNKAFPRARSFLD